MLLRTAQYGRHLPSCRVQCADAPLKNPCFVELRKDRSLSHAVADRHEVRRVAQKVEAATSHRVYVVCEDQVLCEFRVVIRGDMLDAVQVGNDSAEEQFFSRRRRHCLEPFRALVPGRSVPPPRDVEACASP